MQMKTLQGTIYRIVYRITNVIVKTIFVLLAITFWIVGIACLWIFPEFAPIPLLLGALCVLMCKIRLNAGVIVFLCLCPIALPLALRQDMDDDEES